MNVSLRWSVVLAVGLLAIAPPAMAYPFVLMPVGVSLAPLLLLAGAGLLRHRWIALAVAVSILALFTLTDQEERMEAFDHYMGTDSRVLEHLKNHQRLLAALAPAEPARAQAVSWAAAQAERDNLLFVNQGAVASQRGLSLEQITREPALVPERAILLSDDEGVLARAVAGLTGRRWLEGGLNAVLEAQPADVGQDLLDGLPDCAPEACLKVAIPFDYRSRWMGYERRPFDYSIRLEDLFLPSFAPWQTLQRMTDNGRRQLILAMPGAQDERQLLQVLGWVQRHGFADARMLHTAESGYYRLGHTRPEHDEDVSAEVFQDYYGQMQASFAAADIARLCAADVTLVSALDPREQEVARMPGLLAECRVLHLPVEGLLPHEISRYVQSQYAQLQRLGPQRYVGLYTDQPAFNALQMLREAMLAEGYGWIGETFGYATDDVAWPALNAFYERLLNPLYQRVYGERMQVPSRDFLLAAFVLLLVPGMLFTLVRRRAVALLCFALLLLSAGLVVHAWSYYPVHDRYAEPTALARWLLNDPYRIVLLALAACLPWALLLAWLRREPAGLSKQQGLARLRALGLQVPPGRSLRRLSDRSVARACRQVGYPAIFRSNERVAENRDAASMGAHDSIVVRSAADYPALREAWQAMAAPGARPGFLVQPWLPFVATGVVRTGLWQDGRACVRVESSPCAQGVTGNQAADVQVRVLEVEACVCAEEALLRELAQVVEAWPQPLLLEFGLLAEGRVIWLQLQYLASDALLLSAEADYRSSPLNDEFSTTSRGLPLLLSLFNASVPFMQWRLRGRQIVERRRAGFVLAQWLATALPEWLLQRLAQRCLERARRHYWQGRLSLLRLRGVLLLDSLVLLKGVSRQVGLYRPSLAEVEQAGLVSPYAQFAELPALLQRAALDAPLPAARRQRCSLMLRETLRQALGYELGGLSREVCARLQQQGLAAQGLDWLTLADLRRPVWQPRALFADGLEPAASGLREVGAVCVQLHAASEIGAVRQQLAGVTDARVCAAQPWLGLFALSEHVACFDIAAPVHSNSHFMQRAAALGIAVRSGL